MTYRPITVGNDGSCTHVQWGTDPEFYVGRDTLESIPAFILMQAFESAWRTYYTCGGHKLAERMRRAMDVLADELEGRGITPNYSRGGLAPGWVVS